MLKPRFTLIWVNKRFLSQRSVKTVIGLEVHVQLKTASKLFSSAPVGVSECGSNQAVHVFDVATPGTMPTLNRRAVELALKTALLLNSQVAKECRFDRKHYMYPDMPLGYQVTQHEFPIARGGHLDYFIRSNGQTFSKRAHLQQIQLEMDSGKLVHDQRGDLIDLNRAGVGLVEIVSAPCFDSPVDASTFVENLRWLLIANDVSDCQMHHGQLRVDANVSLTTDDVPGAVVEVKNINSFNDIDIALSFEVRRQQRIVDEGGKVTAETRGVRNGKTVFLRSKGDEHDYRFLPEPNIPRLTIRPEWVSQISNTLTTPLHHLYIVEHGFSTEFAFELMYDQPLRLFVDRCITLLQAPPPQFETLIRQFPEILRQSGLNLPSPNDPIIVSYCELMDLFLAERLTRLVFFDLIKFFAQTQLVTVQQKVESENLWRIQSKDEIRSYVHQVLSKSPATRIQNARAGKTKHFNRIRNEIVTSAQKRISVIEVEEYLKEALAQ